MNINKLTKGILAGLVASTALLFVATSASAQGRYSGTYSNNQVKGYIDRLDRSSTTFRRDFDREMDRSPLNGTQTEDRYNALVKDFDRAMSTLKNRYSNNRPWWENRNNVQEMLNRAQPVNTMMMSLPFARQLERQWNAMRNDINVVADTFDLPGLNGGGWHGGNWGGGGWNSSQGRPPSWAVGTWYWTGGGRQLVINQNGTVTVSAGNDIQYGSWGQGSIFLNGQRSTVTRNGSNIRTYNQANGETSDYSRRPGGGGPGWGGGNPGWGNANVPNWAVGSFRWVQGPNRTMVISNNGQITLYIDGNTQIGRWENGMISLGGNMSTVTQTRNGFRTFNQNTGETSDYRRQ
jgi:hypothetical protein